MAGTKETSIRSYNFYTSGSLQGVGATGTYAENEYAFIDADDQTHFLSHSIIIANDGGSPISIRFSADPGTGAPHGVVLATERLELNYKRAKRIYLSGIVAGSAFRLWAW